MLWEIFSADRGGFSKPRGMTCTHKPGMLCASRDGDLGLLSACTCVDFRDAGGKGFTQTGRISERRQGRRQGTETVLYDFTFARTLQEKVPVTVTHVAVAVTAEDFFGTARSSRDQRLAAHGTQTPGPTGCHRLGFEFRLTVVDGAGGQARKTGCSCSACSPGRRMPPQLRPVCGRRLLAAFARAAGPRGALRLHFLPLFFA